MWIILSSALMWLIVALGAATSVLAAHREGLVLSYFLGTAVSTPLAGVLLVAGGAALVIGYYLRQHPARLFKEIPTSGTTVKAQALCDDESRHLLQSSPRVIVASGPTIRDARVYYFGRQPAVVMPQSFAWLALTKPQYLRAILCHELAHIANGDAWRAVVAQFVVSLTMIVVVLSLLVITIAHGIGIYEIAQRYGISDALRQHTVFGYITEVWPSFMLLCLSLLTYSTFLRLREFVADTTAATLGHRVVLREILAKAVPFNLLATLISFHPSPSERLARLRPVNFARGPGSIALMVTTASVLALKFLADNYQPKDTGILAGLISVAPLWVLEALLFTALGFAFGESFRRGRSDRINLPRARRVLLAPVAIWCGACIVALGINLPSNLVAQAPIDVDVSIKLRGAFLSTLSIASFFTPTAYLGFVVGGHKELTQVQRGAWLIFAASVGLASANTTSVLAGWFWRDSTGLFAGLTEIGAELRFDQLTFPGLFVLTQLALLALVVIPSVLLAKRAVPARGTRPFRRLQLAIPLALFVLVLVGGAAFNNLWYQLATHILEKDTLWVSCAVDASVSHADEERINRLSSGLVEAIDEVLVRASTERGVGRARLLEEPCLAKRQAQEYSYPALRRLLAAVGFMRDSGLHIESTRSSNVLLTYQSAHGRTRKVSVTLPVSSFDALANQILTVHDPHRFAISLTDRGPKYFPHAAKLLDALQKEGSDEERAWGSLQLANLALLQGDGEKAEKFGRQAFKLAPDVEVIRARLAYILFRRQLCDEPERLVTGLSGSRLLTAEHVEWWAHCLARRGRDLESFKHLWGRRDRFPKDATFVAAIGETAYRLNRLDLARDYLKAAVDLSPNKVDWCTRVRSACLQKKVRCPTVPPHRPPLVLSGAYEHICWGNILLSYGLNEAAVAYLEQAVSIEPAWGNTQAGKDIERLRRSAADERR